MGYSNLVSLASSSRGLGVEEMNLEVVGVAMEGAGVAGPVSACNDVARGDAARVVDRDAALPRGTLLSRHFAALIPEDISIRLFGYNRVRKVVEYWIDKLLCNCSVRCCIVRCD
mmetsp:Transcript_12271/g.26119  ORF Transcript_12271/g.26119 Transcript_12271/m.26119 type:complete len:114 (-) Transcript_12271:40-381(-)